MPASPLIGVELVAEHIRRLGARATPARIRVLQLLRAAPTALTHGEIELALGASVIDRVTLYRVLDWLVASGLVENRDWTLDVTQVGGDAAALPAVLAAMA